MAIQSIGSSILPAPSPASGATNQGEGFGQVLEDATKKVSSLENQANGMAMKVASGDVADLHNAMIAMQKATLALNLTVEVRNKVLDAYQEIMRMQV